MEQDRLNDELGKRFVRALAVEKAALDVRLSPACIRVLAAISYFMNASTQRAWPGYQQIHEITGHDVDTIERAIKRLKEAGYIFTERRSPITGGRALVHYGLMAVHPSHIDQIITMAVMDLRRRLTQAKIAGPEKNTKQIKAPKAKLTPAKIAGSAHTKTKADGSEKKDHIVNGLQSDPGENSGVRLTPAEAAGSHSDPGIFVPSDPGILPGSNTLSKNTLKEEEEVEAGRLGFLDAVVSVHGVEYPDVLVKVIDDGANKKLGSLLATAIRTAVVKRKVPALVIEADLRKAIAWIIDKSGKREPSSSEIVRTCLTFVERSRADAIDSTVPYETGKAGSGFEPSIDHDWVPPDLRFGRR